ncbi:hypothetical protein BURPS668_A1245 [Burkholderia pseudomallei 668]|nr:hypothetical protein BURPS668_A1245 [Burkholderia pseudomallei 668]
MGSSTGPLGGRRVLRAAAARCSWAARRTHAMAFARPRTSCDSELDRYGRARCGTGHRKRATHGPHIACGARWRRAAGAGPSVPRDMRCGGQ